MKRKGLRKKKGYKLTFDLDRYDKDEQIMIGLLWDKGKYIQKNLTGKYLKLLENDDEKTVKIKNLMNYLFDKIGPRISIKDIEKEAEILKISRKNTALIVGQIKKNGLVFEASNGLFSVL